MAFWPQHRRITIAKKPKAKKNQAKDIETPRKRETLVKKLGQLVYDIGLEQKKIDRINRIIKGKQMEVNGVATQIEELDG